MAGQFQLGLFSQFVLTHRRKVYSTGHSIQHLLNMEKLVPGSN